MKKKLLIIIAAVLLLVLVGCGKEPAEPVESADLAAFEAETGLRIDGIASYSGPYFEDGSDEPVENVAQLTLTNTGDKDYQLVYLHLTDSEGNEYSFKLTSLMHGGSMIALEENRAAYAEGAVIASVTAENEVYFAEGTGMHPEAAALLVDGNSVTVWNQSGAELTNFRAYYKNYDGDVARGGITYTLSVPQLPAGEKATVSTGHYSEDTSRFIFVTFDGME